MRKTETLIRLSKELKEYLAEQAQKEGISQSKYMERLLLIEMTIKMKVGA